MRPAPVSVLVVDDDPASVKLMSVVLEAEGYEVRTASSAEEAGAVLLTFRPRLMTLDLLLPLMSGLDFAQRLKANPDTRDVVIVAVTVFDGPHSESRALAAGCAAYVRKPIDPLAFPQVLLEHLKARPLTSE